MRTWEIIRETLTLLANLAVAISTIYLAVKKDKKDD